MKQIRLVTSGTAAAALAAACISYSTAVSAQSSFQGETVTIYAGASAGGTNDGYTRLVARHIGQYLPGDPLVIVKNLPGAGSRKLASYLSAKARKDGMEFGMLSRDLLVAPVLYPKRDSRFDTRKFVWLGSPTRELLTCVTWQGAPVQNLADLKSKPFIIAGTGGPTSGEVIAGNVLNALVGAKVRTIKGYPGGTEMNLAMQNGEVHGRCALGWGAIRANYYHWIEQKKMKVLVQLALTGDPDLKGVPVLGDLVDKSELGVLELLFANQAMGRPFAAPPGLSKSMTTQLRSSFEKTIADPKFLAEAKKMRFDILPVKGEEIQALVNKLYASSAETLARARKLAGPSK